MKNIKLFLIVIATSVVLGSCVSNQIVVPPNTTAYYVSPDGNDSWSGTIASPGGINGPFATISRARDAIRTLKKEGLFNQSVIVYVRQGTYFLNQTLEFTPEDSGDQTYSITYCAYPGEQVVLSGGEKITSRLTPTESGVVKTAIPQVTQGDWFFYQLFINGERRTRARTPNDGFFNMVGKMELEGSAHFTFNKDDIKEEWAGRGDVDVIGLAKWAEIRMPIVAVDAKENTATLTKQVPPSNWNGAKNPRYWIENAPQALDQPGEWRLDKHTGILSFILVADDDIDDMCIIAPRLEHIIRIAGQPEQERFVSNLCFKGFAFKHTIAPKLQEGYDDVQAAYNISAAFSAEGARNCRVQNCQFTQIGNYAVEFSKGCQENVIIGNEMGDIGAGGVKIGEPTMREGALDARGNQVTDNHIHHIGVMYPAAVGIWVGQSSYNLLAYNHIHHSYYTGLSVGWSWGYHPTGAHHNIVEFNDVHHIGQGILSDMGGIYTLGTQPGTVIRYNLFHDIYSFSYGGWGIYPDEGSTRILVENNVTYRTKSAGFHQHYGKENTIRNNIFAFAKEYQVMRTRAEEHISLIFERNIVIFDQGELLGSNWSGENYKLDNNIYWDTRQKEIRFSKWSWAEWQAKGNDKHSLIADPMFENALEYDFRLKENSPASKIGFNPIDLSKIGPRKEFAFNCPSAK